MSLQGRAWLRLFHSLWRVSGSSNNQAVTSLSGPARCLHQGASSSLHATTPPPPPPPPHSSPTAVAAASSTGGGLTPCGVDSVLDVCGALTSLSLKKQGRHTARKGLSVTSWPNDRHLGYFCPSEKLISLPELVILEEMPNSVSYDLPQTPAVPTLIIDPATNSAEISEPTSTTTNTPKEAREIMKIRRKKMKRHLLKKFRKRMAFTLRKMKRARRKKKEAKFQIRLAGIKEWGDAFNANDWVQEELDKARKGGFYINIMEKRQ